MIYYYDLHIHSVLSPDADVLMTPNNIFNMAYLKKLDIIAVTDHNSTKQLKIMKELSESYDMLFIPGIELSLAEDIHVCCYFASTDDAYRFDNLLEPWRNNIRYDGHLGSEQGITDINDEIVEVYPFDLSINLSLSLLELRALLQPFRHILVFAHVDRNKHSGLSHLSNFKPDAIELSSRASQDFIHAHHLNQYKIFYNSDAHMITDINERNDYNHVELESLSIDAFFDYIHHG
jgi:PHP family Zn ribbon phosphoesterase